ncbi:unnamed protein product [Cylicocyclus nassatus]|uniref:Chitin-binding type-2 domain-containing protein n=1 Tax=Cylicocyclus nassatus TaxID=53992 RepID=A0AA36MHU8_CYLNA|nr:unnamed protein product [Cylicocyclus nassatus]
MGAKDCSRTSVSPSHLPERCGTFKRAATHFPFYSSLPMRLPLLLTVIGLAVGQDERICDSRVNGLYAVGPCSPYYDHCYNGIAARKPCGDGLVFNPDSKMCDFDGNVKGCANRMKMSCMNKKDGTYTIGCSSTYFHCVNGQIVNNQVDTCSNGLFYDSERNMCDYKWRVRACGGNPELESKSVTSPPLALATQQPKIERTIYTARIRGRGHHHRHSRPSTSCHGKPDGPHPVSSCSQQYITCANATSQLAECPDFQVFSSAEHKCVPIETVHECSGPSPASQIDCSFEEDGYYELGCTSNFVFCSDGKASAMKAAVVILFFATMDMPLL